MLVYTVTWRDAEGNERSKTYDNEAAAVKARRWLALNGAKSIDMSVRSKK